MQLGGILRWPASIAAAAVGGCCSRDPWGSRFETSRFHFQRFPAPGFTPYSCTGQHLCLAGPHHRTSQHPWISGPDNPVRPVGTVRHNNQAQQPGTRVVVKLPPVACCTKHLSQTSRLVDRTALHCTALFWGLDCL